MGTWTTSTNSRVCVIPEFVCCAAAAKSLQSCPTLCDPIDGSPPGSPVPGILQARTLEWVAISFSSAWKWKVKVKSLSRVWLLATPWTTAYQAPPSMGFSRQEYWSGVPLPSLVCCATSLLSYFQYSGFKNYFHSTWLIKQIKVRLLWLRRDGYPGSFRWCYLFLVVCLVTRSCPILCDPMDCSLRGSSVRQILQAKFWNEKPFPYPGDLPNPGVKPRSPSLQVDSLPSDPPGTKYFFKLKWHWDILNFLFWELMCSFIWQ